VHDISIKHLCQTFRQKIPQRLSHFPPHQLLINAKSNSHFNLFYIDQIIRLDKKLFSGVAFITLNLKIKINLSTLTIKI